MKGKGNVETQAHNEKLYLMKKLMEKLVRKTYQIERLTAAGKINPINGTIEMRKVLEKEIGKIVSK